MVLKEDTPQHAVSRNVERNTHGFNNNKATVALFPYIEWAFDKVANIGLIVKLIMAKTPWHLIHIIHNHLQNRSFYIMHRRKEATGKTKT
jgi:hypothetical protein